MKDQIGPWFWHLSRAVDGNTPWWECCNQEAEAEGRCWLADLIILVSSHVSGLNLFQGWCPQGPPVRTSLSKLEHFPILPLWFIVGTFGGHSSHIQTTPAPFVPNSRSSYPGLFKVPGCGCLSCAKNFLSTCLGEVSACSHFVVKKAEA